MVTYIPEENNGFFGANGFDLSDVGTIADIGFGITDALGLTNSDDTQDYEDIGDGNYEPVQQDYTMYYVIGGVLLLVVILLILYVAKKRKKK